MKNQFLNGLYIQVTNKRYQIFISLSRSLLHICNRLYEGCLLSSFFISLQLNGQFLFCNLLPGASAAIPVLPGADLDRHVAPQQQLAVSELPPQPAARVPREGALHHAQYRRPAAVPLYQGRVGML